MSDLRKRGAAYIRPFQICSPPLFVGIFRDNPSLSRLSVTGCTACAVWIVIEHLTIFELGYKILCPYDRNKNKENKDHNSWQNKTPLKYFRYNTETFIAHTTDKEEKCKS